MAEWVTVLLSLSPPTAIFIPRECGYSKGRERVRTDIRARQMNALNTLAHIDSS
jgi:hypothetical protein